jgi:uncharacterized protein YpmS
VRLKYFLFGLAMGIVVSVVAAVVALLMLVSKPLPVAHLASQTVAGDVTVTVQEGYLSEMASEMAKEKDPSVQGVVVDLRPANRLDLTVQTRVSVLGLQMTLGLKVVTSVQVENGRLKLATERLDLAGLGIPVERLPDSITAGLEAAVDEVSDEANRALAKSGFTLLSVTTDEQGITVVARATE